MSSSLQRLKSRLTGNIFGASNKAAAVSQPDLSRGNQSPADTSHFSNLGDEFDYGVFQYPEDLGNNDFGHYILFHIYERTNSKYVNPTTSLAARALGGGPAGFGNAKTGPKGAFEGITRSSTVTGKEVQDGTEVDPTNVVTKRDAFGNPVGEVQGRQGLKLSAEQRSGFSTSYNLRKEHFKQSKDTIALYLPPGIGASYKHDYKNSETGVAGMVMQTLGMKGSDQSFMDYLRSNANSQNANTLAATIGDMLGAKGALKVAEFTGAGDPTSQLEKMRNEAPNPALEAIFTGTGFRTFTYNFRFTPRSEREVRVVDDIVKLFKFHAAPERMFGEKVGRHLRMPAEFDIFYMYQGQQNAWYPMVHSCVCNSVNVTYGPGGESQHFRKVDGSPAPTETNMSLEFTETEIITKELVKEGF